MSNPNAESDNIRLADLAAAHRDLLWVVAQTGPTESRSLHRELSTYYTKGIDQTRVCAVLEELIEYDYVTERTHDTVTYRLTESARRALAARQAWQAGSHDVTEGGHK
ncbi:PadR family transcriptional regulator [Halorubrum sp. RMP-47]|uniref:PadR family transcriptional regulator n=1 Tax=Halorubrum miltondacostae TaxID=3076378 RepID=A0ABD5M356_9EURY